MSQIALPPDLGHRRDRAAEVNRQFKSIACAGCGKAVRVHPSVTLVICAGCSLTSVREKRRAK